MLCLSLVGTKHVACSSYDSDLIYIEHRVLGTGYGVFPFLFETGLCCVAQAVLELASQPLGIQACATMPSYFYVLIFVFSTFFFYMY
jgi:hypothetical protein